jgi:hypothetical protein
MVRIYANLAGLSNTLARTGLAGNESRSIASFTSSFTRSQDLFDFIDAGDKKEGADFKIRGTAAFYPAIAILSRFKLLTFLRDVPLVRR